MDRHVEQLNYLAIGLLEKLGNIEPTEAQIEIVEYILSQVVLHWGEFDKGLTLSEVVSILLVTKYKTSKKIAGLLNISQINVEEHYEEIKNKLNFSTLKQTVLKLENIRVEYVISSY